MMPIAILLALIIVAVGVVGLFSPSRVIRIARSLESRAGLYYVAALRLVFGVALLYSAEASRAPGLIRTIGVLLIVAGVVTPFLGVARFRRIVDWWSTWGGFLHRLWATVAIAFGLLLIWAVVP